MTDERLKFGEQELQRLFGGKDVGPYLEWRDGEGVFVRPLSPIELEPGHLTSDHRRLRLQHPTGNLDVPALPFPCTIDQFKAFIRLPAAWLSKLEDWKQASEGEVTAFAEDAQHAVVLVRVARGGTTVAGPGGQAVMSKAERLTAIKRDKERLEAAGCTNVTQRLAEMWSLSDRRIRQLLEEPKPKRSAATGSDWKPPRARK